MTANLTILLTFLLLSGCAQQTKPAPPVDVRPAMRQVDKAVKLSTDARKVVADARTEAAKPDPNLQFLRDRLGDADAILLSQGNALTLAQADLVTAQQAAALSAEELAHHKAESDKYRRKYEALKKYRWLVIGVSAWLVVKLLGSLGAWHPAGRIGRFFA